MSPRLPALLAALLCAAAGAQQAPAPATAPTAAPAPETLDSGMQRCRTLTDMQQRLACYDALPTSATPAAPAAPVEPYDPKVVRSRIAGGFEGWKRHQTFTLENGQRWKVIGDDVLFVDTLESPAVTIKQSGSGAWWMSVDGVSQNVKVRRLDN